MAIIPNDEKFMIIDNNTQTSYTGSSMLQERQKYYTIQDLKDTVGSGGGSNGGNGNGNGNGGGATAAFPPLEMIVDAPLNSQSMLISYVINSAIPAGFYGEGSFATKVIPQMQFGGWNGSTATTIEFPTLEEGIVNLSSFSQLTNVSLPSLKSLFNANMGGNISITGNNLLTTIDLSGVTYVQDGVFIMFSNNKLSAATMEGLFQILVDSEAINGSFNILSQINDTPNAATLALKQTLLDRGWSVSM